MRLESALLRTYRGKPQVRFGTVVDVQPGICTVQVAGGPIPVIYLKGAAPSVGDFVSVQRQGVVSYLLNQPSGAVWVGDNVLNGIWRVPTSGQDPVFYAVPGAAIYGVVEGPDQAIWACSGGGGAAAYVWRMVSSGLYIGTSASVQLGSSLATFPVSICVGSDGNLWVADNNGFVWKVTPDLAVAASYALAGSSPNTICAGPGGNLWIASGTPNTGAWSVTPSGTSTFYPIPDSVPTGITEGPDGRLWLSDNTYHVVWAMAPTGNVESYLLPNSETTSICVGPDKRLWASDNFLGVIWAVTTTGDATPYSPVYGAASQPVAVATASDARVWAADLYGPSVDAMTAAGVPSSYLLASTAHPSSICSGP